MMVLETCLARRMALQHISHINFLCSLCSLCFSLSKSDRCELTRGSKCLQYDWCSESGFNFFSTHPKRQKKLEEAIENTKSESTVHKLKDLCRTRWIERIDALDQFQTLHSSLIVCMETISAEGTRKWSPDSVTDTRLLAITTTDFISSLVITTACLKYWCWD